jgi:hypothetical protein
MPSPGPQRGGLAQPRRAGADPEVYADGEKLTKAVNEHRRVGPVVVIAPKWQTMPVDTRQPGLRRGWVRVIGTELPQWKGFLDDVTVNTRGFGTGRGGWRPRCRCPRRCCPMRWWWKSAAARG